MDVGKSLNPAIDVGQIEGAFMQGVGLFLLEELVYDELGRLCTAGPVTYKIPAINDTPLEFNVSFLMGPGNPKAIYSSKVPAIPYKFKKIYFNIISRIKIYFCMFIFTGDWRTTFTFGHISFLCSEGRYSNIS